MKSRFPLERLVAALPWCTMLAMPLHASAQAMLDSPDWQILVTDAGYSDYLGDLTQTFQGREYLSGEWGAAVGYRKGGSAVPPTWLEPNFIFPDWQTNSSFSVVTPMALTGTNAYGLPVATSVIANSDISISQRLEIVDTVVGTPMGTSPASAGGAGSFISSNRYVLLQSYSVTNLSLDTALSDLQFFQLLHGFNSQAGAYDNRSYAGPLAEYRYDVTQRGQDDVSGTGQFDYIGFHSKVAPSAFEIGRYGVEGVDDHVSGKPSEGVHLSVENNWQGGYAALNGTDAFSPANRWVAGAQRWDLGTLAPGQSASIDVALSIRTGWIVNPGPEGGASGSANGGSAVPGGVDYVFQEVSGPGTFYAEYEAEDQNGVQELITLGKIGPITFTVPGPKLQLFEVEYEGSFIGQVLLTFGYDPSLLNAGVDPGDLRVFHWTGTAWEDLGGTVNPASNTIAFYTDSLSPFAVGAVPEPETWVMLLAGFGLVLVRLARSRLR